LESFRRKLGSFLSRIDFSMTEVESFFFGLIVLVFLPSQQIKIKLKNKSIKTRIGCN
jgi:hypothetical protein